MLDNFMKSPQENALAVIVLIALLAIWGLSLILNIRDVPIQAERGWYARLLPLFSLLGIPAALDLLETSGITLLFAAIIATIFALNVIIPILHIVGLSSHPLVQNWYRWAILASCIGGLTVAGYLTYMEAIGAYVVCGSSSGCSIVQGSEYARLFGIVPVGLLGLLGYGAILLGWLMWQFGPAALQRVAALAIWTICILGVMFSIYLTFLEPFVIGATCMWCISSAVFMLLLLLLSTPPAQQALLMDEPAAEC